MERTLDTSPRLAIRGVFQALLLHIGGVFPNDFAGARIDQLEAVENVVASARGGASAHALQLAFEEIIGAFEFLGLWIAGRSQISRALGFAFLFERGHGVAREKAHAALGIPIQFDAD